LLIEKQRFEAPDNRSHRWTIGEIVQVLKTSCFDLQTSKCAEKEFSETKTFSLRYEIWKLFAWYKTWSGKFLKSV